MLIIDKFPAIFKAYFTKFANIFNNVDSYMKKHNYSAGPCILPQEVFEKSSQAVLNYNNSGLSILEISHRSKEFVSIINEARNLALELLGLQNKGYQALFLHGGASLQFLMVPHNLMKINGKAVYLDSGAWAAAAIKEAKLFGTTEIVASSKDSHYSYVPKNYEIPVDADYFHCTSNNTIFGTQMKSFPKTNIPLVCDMSSDIFSREIDFSAFGLFYAGAQKNMGPAGTTLVIIKEEILGKTGRVIPGILDYQQHLAKESMYNTPSVFAIYCSLLTLQWLKKLGGISAVEKLNKQKASLLYSEIDRNPLFGGTATIEDRSDMNVVFTLNNLQHKEIFDKLLEEAGISGLNGHRSVGGYRASIYNAMPFDSVKALIEVMQELENRI